MEEKDDGLIQQWLDKGLLEENAFSAKDIRVYQIVFDSLKKEPEVGLSYGFSDKVERLIIQQKRKSSQRLLYICFSIAGVIVFAGGISLWMNKELTSGMADMFSKYQWPIIFGVSGLLLIQFLDHKLLKQRLLKGV